MIAEKSKKTKSSYLLLPLLGENRDYFDFTKGLVCTYIQCKNHPEYKTHLFLEYNLSTYSTEYIENLEERICKELNDCPFEKIIDIDHDKTVYIYDLSKHIEIYDFFLLGKYSKFNVKYKEQILNFHQGQAKGITSVLNRSQIMLKNIHKSLGCMANVCSCNNLTYLNCKNFNNFPFDFDNLECWGRIGSEEILIYNQKQFIYAKSENQKTAS
jgi:hypothetical protein